MKVFLRSIFFFILFIDTGIFAQQYVGIVGSNYAGSNSIYANPANIVDSRYKIYVNLAAADLFIGNNAVRWNAPYNFLRILKGGIATSQKVKWKSDYLSSIDNNREKNMNGIIDVRGPSILYTIDSKQGIALTSRGRGAVSFTNVSPELAVLIQNGSKNPTVVRSATNQHFNLNENAFAEIGITYGKDISLNAEEALKLGITVKRVIGLSNFHMATKGSDFQIVNNVVNPNDLTHIYDDVLFLQHVKGSYGFSSEDTGINDFSLKPGYWLGTASPGRGIGLDIGISYEHRPEIHKYEYKEKGITKWDQTQNKYQYKIGFSLIDIGRVKFDNPAYASDYEVTSDNKYIWENDFKKMFPTYKFINSINNTLGVNSSQDKHSFTAAFPTTLQAYIDYKLQDNIYLYGTWVQNLRTSNSLGMRMPSLVSIVPRYESKWIDLALPISLLNDYQLLAIGLSARFGPVFIGSDNLQGLFNIANPRGMDLFAGISIPIFNKLPSSPTKCYYDQPTSRFNKFFKRKSKKAFKGSGQI